MSIAVAVTTGLHTATPAAAIATINVVQYWHKDNLGSTVATTNAAGVVLGRYSYDPFGKRRDITGKYDPWGNLVIDWGETGANAGPDRGFTGHEHLDDVGIIHMNGRLYDPLIGRMMQADQIIASLQDMQHFNRYSYVYNRPTSLVDANGQCPICYVLGALIFARAAGIIDQQTFRMGLSIVAAIWLGNPQGFLAQASTPFVAASVAGFASGAISTGTWEGAFQGMATAMLFYGAGTLSGEGYLNLTEGGFGRALVHAGAGCINARLSGGSCAKGAMTAGASQFLEANLPGSKIDDLALGTMRAAVIGGTVSVIGGGKFANGARTAAYQYLFNKCAHGSCTKEDIPDIRKRMVECAGKQTCIREVAADYRQAGGSGAGSDPVEVLKGFFKWSSLPLDLNPLGRGINSSIDGLGVLGDIYSGNNADAAGTVGAMVYGAAFERILNPIGHEFSARFGAYASKVVEPIVFKPLAKDIIPDKP
jgi:RHS repeat-associated protein